MKYLLLSVDSSSAEPVFRVIFLIEATGDNSLSGAGMYKLPVFEIDAYVCHFLSRRGAGEEHQISLAQIAAGDFTTLF